MTGTSRRNGGVKGQPCTREDHKPRNWTAVHNWTAVLTRGPQASLRSLAEFALVRLLMAPHVLPLGQLSNDHLDRLPVALTIAALTQRRTSCSRRCWWTSWCGDDHYADDVALKTALLEFYADFGDAQTALGVLVYLRLRGARKPHFAAQGAPSVRADR